MFGIEDNPYTIGNFILGAITKYPIYKTLPGGGGNSKLYVYSLHKYGLNKFLKVLVLLDGRHDGYIVTAFPADHPY
ncbi:hypothetical protein LCGC14_0709990 [marine sediment metagenome]|uniref:Uncharacterized protein n=1 Tax=marine sediment metagenome TaxID=412755 RepID=A0A0F9T0Z2_9ZZZZ|nr:hypothetical protein [bacterium]